MARVLLTNFHPDDGGGHITYIETLLRLKNHTIGVATPKTSKLYRRLKEYGYPYLFACDFPAKPQKELRSIFSNIKIFRYIANQFDPQIIHTNGGADLSLVAWAFPRNSSFKIIRTHHAIKKIKTDLYHKWLYFSRIAHNIYVSNSAQKLSTSNRALVPQPFTIIENGVDTNYFSPRPKDENLLHEFSLSDDIFIFGSSAGTGSYKRIDIIIKAAALIQKESQKKFKILILGHKKPGSELQRMANDLGINFQYCGYKKDVRNFVSLLDVGFILSDRTETISYAAREMMSMGKRMPSIHIPGLLLPENLMSMP